MTDKAPTVDITIFIPCYNEEKNIVPTLNMVLETLQSFTLTYDIWIIDDASTDRSVENIQAFIQNNPTLPIHLKIQATNQNLGFNFVEGAFLGNGRYYMRVNGDLEINSRSLQALLKHIGEADMILSHHPHDHRSLCRSTLSRTFTGIVNFISNQQIRYYNGTAIFLRQDVLRWHPYTNGYAFQAMLIAQLLERRKTVAEVRTDSLKRNAGHSHAFRLCNIFSVAYSLIGILGMRVVHIYHKAP